MNNSVISPISCYSMTSGQRHLPGNKCQVEELSFILSLTQPCSGDLKTVGCGSGTVRRTALECTCALGCIHSSQRAWGRTGTVPFGDKDIVAQEIKSPKAHPASSSSELLCTLPSSVSWASHCHLCTGQEQPPPFLLTSGISLWVCPLSARL